MKERNIAVDVLKAFAIVLVVVGHTIQLASGEAYEASRQYLDHWLFRGIYSFHMPLFMLLSGYCCTYSVKNGGWVSNIGKKLRGLLLPIVTWRVLYALLTGETLIYASLTETVRHWFFKIYGAWWFLWAVLLCSVAVILCRHFFRDHWLVYVLGFAVSLLIPDHFGMNEAKFVYPFFVLGYLYHEKWEERLRSKLRGKTLWLVFAGSVVLYFLLLPLYGRDSYVYLSGMCVLRANGLMQLWNDLYRDAVGLFGSLTAVIAVKLLTVKLQAWNGLWHRVAGLGEKTLGIYVISTILFIPAGNLTARWNGPSVFSVLGVSAFLIAASVIIETLLRRIPLTAFLFFGKLPKKDVKK